MSVDKKVERLRAINENKTQAIEAMSEQPGLAQGTIGRLVLDMMGSGDDISHAAITAELEAIVEGNSLRIGYVPVLAQGALKAISDITR
jgi:hypothetical protein